MSGIGSDHARLQCDCVSQIGYLEEIVMDILARLPVKNVVQCKCVAKHWLRLISEPQFPAMQLSLSERKLKYIICPYPRRYNVISRLSLMEENGNISRTFPLPDFNRNCYPEMSCFVNGLICSVDEYEDENNEDLIDVNIRIFNPITQNILLLPRGSPSHITPTVGVAFDQQTFNFKAFRFFSDSPEEEIRFKCEVYTSVSAEWRMISEDVEPPEDNSFNSHIPNYVSLAGKMYWFVWSANEPEKVDYILSVDMNDNFKEINVPISMHQWSFLIELEGCLSVVHLSYPESYDPHRDDSPKPYVEVYKFENEVWCFRARAELDVKNIFSFNSVAARDNEIFFIIRLEDGSYCYLILDLKYGTSMTLDLTDTFAECSPVAFPFAESLLKCSGA